MKLLVLMLVLLLALGCAVESSRPTPTFPLTFTNGLPLCEKSQVRFGSVQVGNSLMLQNHGNCNFLGGFVINGSIKVGGGVHMPEAASDAVWFESTVFVEECEIQLTVPRLKAPCRVYP